MVFLEIPNVPKGTVFAEKVTYVNVHYEATIYCFGYELYSYVALSFLEFDLKWFVDYVTTLNQEHAIHT